MWGREVTRTYATRTVYSDERSCVNCTRELECWPESGIVLHNLTHWRLRASWDRRDADPYFKTVYGGICLNFNHSDPTINARHQAAEAKKLMVKEHSEWEE
jgi:hypothetical protein